MDKPNTDEAISKRGRAISMQDHMVLAISHLIEAARDAESIVGINHDAALTIRDALEHARVAQAKGGLLLKWVP